MLTTSFRRSILQELKRRGWSHYRLAKESSLPERSVFAYLAGDRDMSGERVAALCDAIGLKLVRSEKGDRLGRGAQVKRQVK